MVSEKRNLISINQDPLGEMGRRILKVTGNVEIWSKSLQNDRTAVSFLIISLSAHTYLLLVRRTLRRTIWYANSCVN